MQLVNIYTGEQATPELMQEAQQRARQIFRNPYSTPQQLEWASQIDPEGFVDQYLFADRPKKNVTVACGKGL